VSQRILLATRSRHKAAEIQRILRSTTHAQLITLDEAGISESAEEDDLENEPTFIGNARAKALYFARKSSVPTIADDSGLEVRALAWGPGVRTRRFAIDAGYAGPSGDALDEANNRLLLERLSALPEGERQARYVCAAAFAHPNGEIASAIGTAVGAIAFSPTGTGGFGYDPLFFIPDLGLTFAQLTPEQKDQRSHRARAFRALATIIH
jgi:XTP/dITP diphosphohydrolase